jgi:hypothetical protein
MGKIYSHFKQKFYSQGDSSKSKLTLKNEIQTEAPSSNSESELKNDQENAVMAITSKSLTMVNAKMGVYDNDEDE